MEKAEYDEIFYDEIENATDSLEKAIMFLKANDKFKWKWFTISIHHALHNFCIAALHNGDWANVVKPKKWSPKGPFYFSRGSENDWKVSVIESVANAGPAFRFKWKPAPDFKNEREEFSLEKRQQYYIDRFKDYEEGNVLGFWTALAMVQDGENFMGRYVMSKPVILTDEELQEVFWLSEERNLLIHYKPSLRDFDIARIKSSGLIAVNVIHQLVIEGFNILNFQAGWREKIQQLLDEASNYLKT